MVGRLVLMYMSDPADALKQLTRHLRPGGIVAFQEVDFTPYISISRSDTPLMNKLVEWGVAVFQRSGAHTEMGMDLHRHFFGCWFTRTCFTFCGAIGGRRNVGWVRFYCQCLSQSGSAYGRVWYCDC